MKASKKLLLISSMFFLFVFVSAGLNSQFKKAKADDPPRIICHCTGGGKCKADGAGSVCAQSEPGGNIHCDDYNGNCHIGIK